MPTTTPNKLVIPTRADLVTRYKNDFAYRAPGISTAEGTLPDIDANVTADLLLPVFTEASRQADANVLAGQDQAQLDQICTAMGIATNLPAVGASGYVVITTAVGGANIPAGAEIRNLNTGQRYQCAAGGLYNSNGASANPNVPVTGVDVGPGTNVNANTVLQWTSPVLGLLPQATVFQNADGTGLTGGANQETLDEQRQRIINARAFPAVAGDDAAYQLAMTETPGVAIGAAFTYPAWAGPGVTCCMALLRPSVPGANQIMNAAQIGLMKAYVIGQMPKDDGAFFGVIIAQPVDLVLSVAWASNVASWADGGSAWPPSAATTYPYTISAASSPTSFSVSVGGDPNAALHPPSAGQTIALFVAANVTASPQNVFVQKRILSATLNGGTGNYDIVVDTTNGASDLSYTPIIGQRVMPWSTSLAQLVSPIVTYFASLGPGEQQSSFFDSGYRQARNPPNPQSWPSALTAKALIAIEELDAIADAAIASPSTPFNPNIGVPGVSAYRLTLNSLSAYPK